MKNKMMKRFISMILAVMAVATMTIPAFASSFSDVKDGAWYAKAVDFCEQSGLMSGVGNGVFSPGGNVTRAQVTQTVWNSEGKPSNYGNASFSDVATSAWYAKAVLWCKNNGIVNGTSSTTFSPNANVTRQDFCVILFNYVKKKGIDVSNASSWSTVVSSFNDADKVSDYAKDAIRWATSPAVGVMGGSAGNLNPKGKLSRGELAQFLMNIFDSKKLSNGTTRAPILTINPSSDDPTTVIPIKCEHGNDPATCPICNNADIPQGLYNPKPSQATIDSILSTTYYGGYSPLDMFKTSENFMKTEEARQGFIDEPAGVDTSCLVYMVDDPEYGLFYDDFVYSTLTQGVDHRWNAHMKSVPTGGYTEGGRVYNRYGQDVSSVDGRMTDFEANVYRALNYREFAMNSNYYDDHSHESTSYFKECVQAAAEDRLVQVLENIENYAKAGCPEKPAETRFPSTKWNGTSDVSYITLEPTWSRRLVELSKQYSNESALVNKFLDEYKMEKYGTTQLPSTWTVDWDYGSTQAIIDWVDDTTQNGKFLSSKSVNPQEIVVHFDESVRNAYGLSPTDIASAAGAMMGGGRVIFGGADSFMHPAVGVAYDAASGTCVILTATWHLT